MVQDNTELWKTMIQKLQNFGPEDHNVNSASGKCASSAMLIYTFIYNKLKGLSTGKLYLFVPCNRRTRECQAMCHATWDTNHAYWRTPRRLLPRERGVLEAGIPIIGDIDSRVFSNLNMRPEKVEKKFIIKNRLT